MQYGKNAWRGNLLKQLINKPGQGFGVAAFIYAPVSISMQQLTDVLIGEAFIEYVEVRSLAWI